MELKICSAGRILFRGRTQTNLNKLVYCKVEDFAESGQAEKPSLSRLDNSLIIRTDGENTATRAACNRLES